MMTTGKGRPAFRHRLGGTLMLCAILTIGTAELADGFVPQPVVVVHPVVSVGRNLGTIAPGRPTPVVGDKTGGRNVLSVQGQGYRGGGDRDPPRRVGKNPVIFNQTGRWNHAPPVGSRDDSVGFGGNGRVGGPVIGNANGGGDGVPPANERRYVADEVLIELAGAPTDQTFNAIAARYRLTRLETQAITLTNSTWARWRISDRRAAANVVRALAADRTIRWAQPNYLFDVEGNAPPKADAGVGTPADLHVDEAEGSGQYALEKLHLIQAQTVARGDRVVVAVLDSQIDQANSELADRIAGSFDALGMPTPMEGHGTAIAGIIAAHQRLLGAAPGVRILGVRAFGGGLGNTFSIIKGLDWAVNHDAKIINMSFAGPADPAMARVIAASYDRGRILFAAVGNKGPKSPPLYPAADPHVIGVTATDAHDRLFALANRGDQVAIAAPGVDILVAAPDNAYAVSSGTSFSTAYASGIAALLVGRNPDLKPEEVKRILTSTARPLAPNGRDDQFGAGLMDADRALRMVPGRPAAQLLPASSVR